MPSLSVPAQERFARLIAQGLTQTAAYAACYPDAKQPESSGSRLYAQPAVRARVAEIRYLVDSQFAMALGEKRDLLRRMAAGEIPTKVVRRPGGSVEAVFDRLAALQLDAKIAGELAPERLQIDAGPTLRLEFDTLDRSRKLPPTLEAEFVALSEADLARYQQVKVTPDAPSLADAGGLLDEQDPGNEPLTQDAPREG
jgi:hypothetical protein